MLDGLRILDLTNEIGFLCGKVLADLRADVIKIEKPRGDSSRNQGPFWHDIPDPQKSLFWAAYNAGKRSVTLDVTSRDGQELFKRLVKSADCVIESFPPGYMDSLDLGYEALSQINQRIVLTSVTPFGQNGPYKDYAATEMVISALGGVLYLVGHEDSAPVHTNFPLSVYASAALEAAMGTVIAMHESEATGLGQRVDVSAQASTELMTVHAALNWEINQTMAARKGPATTSPQGGWPMRVHWRCKDGYVAFRVMLSPSGIKSARNLAEWMRSEGFPTGAFGEAHWETMHLGSLTREEVNQLEKPIGDFFIRHTMAELYHKALQKQLLLAPAATIKDMVESPQLEALDYWKPVDEPALGGTLSYPTFMQTSETNAEVRSHTPSIGEHNQEIYIDELGLSDEQVIVLKEVGVI